MSNTTTAPKKKVLIIAIVAFLVLACAVIGFLYYSNNIKVESIIDIDINPSIEISTNKNDKVVDVKAINADSEKVLDDMDLKGVDLKVALNAIIGSLVKNGYLVEDAENNILVTVVNDDDKKAIHTRNLVISDIDEALKSSGIEAEIVNQEIKDDTDARSFAESANISLGKATLILNLCSKDASLDKDKLAKMSLHEIADVINEKDIDITDIVDYEADDSVWENVEDSVEEVDEKESTTKKADKTTTTTKKASSDKITADKAKSIALAKAGLKESEVKGLKAEYDYDDGVAKYDVEFKANGYEYDVEVNAKTGAIIDFDKEKDDDAVDSTKKTKAKTSATSTGITAKEAKSIALKHAGLSSSDVAYIKCELDTEDNGDKVYEVEFLCKGYEYDYTISKATGKIIESEKELEL